jgi:hypothetical protein
MFGNNWMSTSKTWSTPSVHDRSVRAPLCRFSPCLDRFISPPLLTWQTIRFAEASQDTPHFHASPSIRYRTRICTSLGPEFPVNVLHWHMNAYSAGDNTFCWHEFQVCDQDGFGAKHVRSCWLTFRGPKTLKWVVSHHRSGMMITASPFNASQQK